MECVNEKFWGKTMLETSTSPTVMLTVVDAEPTELLAQTVNTAR